MSDFPAKLDDQLGFFCKKNGLHVSSRYQGEEMRSVELVDDQGAGYQIWLETLDGAWIVKAWDRKSFTFSCIVENEEFGLALENTYKEVMSWILSAGHTRTIY